MSDKNLLNHKDLADVKVDTITIFFSIHYIFNKKENIDNLFNNIKHFLKPNGYCLITTFDGKKVFDTLNKSVNEENGKKYIEKRNDKGELIYKIEMTKQYLDNLKKHDNQFPDNEDSLNFPIDVTFETFGKQREYLVNK